jgi:Protein of unknown function (DUF1203)
MSCIRVIALPSDVAESVRTTRRAPRYLHPAHEELASGYGPCRHCLRTFDVGVDRRILFTYDPFADVESLPLPGPVFIHAETCQRYDECGGFPEQLRSLPLTLEAYARGRVLRAQDHVTNGKVDEAVERLLSRPDVDYLHVRDTKAGCYDFRIERSQPKAGAGPHPRER